MATSPGKSLKVLESPGIRFSPGKESWKNGKFDKSPGKVLEFTYFLKNAIAHSFLHKKIEFSSKFSVSSINFAFYFVEKSRKKSWKNLKKSLKSTGKVLEFHFLFTVATLLQVRQAFWHARG